MFRIPRNALVFVGDGRKALFLRNAGDALSPDLKTEKVFVDTNPMTREQGSDRPGRVVESSFSSRKSAVEQTDWHDIEEHRFTQTVAAALEQMVKTNKPRALLVVAPPRTLADLRAAFRPEVTACIVAEINKDLTKHSVAEIEKHLLNDSSTR